MFLKHTHTHTVHSIIVMQDVYYIYILAQTTLWQADSG